MNKKLLTVATTVIFSSSAFAAVTLVDPISIDFSGKYHGEFITDQDLGGVVLTSTSNGSYDEVQVYAGRFIDAGDPDQDLIFDGIGIIIPEHAPSTTTSSGRRFGVVDDDRAGGITTISLGFQIDYFQFQNVDQDNNESVTVRFYNGDTEVNTFDLSPTGNGNSELVTFDLSQSANRVEVDRSASGAIGDPAYRPATSIPEPTTSLFALTLIPLLAKRRR